MMKHPLKSRLQNRFEALGYKNSLGDESSVFCGSLTNSV